MKEKFQNILVCSFKFFSTCKRTTQQQKSHLRKGFRILNKYVHFFFGQIAKREFQVSCLHRQSSYQIELIIMIFESKPNMTSFLPRCKTLSLSFFTLLLGRCLKKEIKGSTTKKNSGVQNQRTNIRKFEINLVIICIDKQQLHLGKKFQSVDDRAYIYIQSSNI